MQVTVLLLNSSIQKYQFTNKTQKKFWNYPRKYICILHFINIFLIIWIHFNDVCTYVFWYFNQYLILFDSFKKKICFHSSVTSLLQNIIISWVGFPNTYFLYLTNKELRKECHWRSTDIDFYLALWEVQSHE